MSFTAPSLAQEAQAVLRSGEHPRHIARLRRQLAADLPDFESIGVELDGLCRVRAALQEKVQQLCEAVGAFPEAGVAAANLAVSLAYAMLALSSRGLSLSVRFKLANGAIPGAHQRLLLAFMDYQDALTQCQRLLEELLRALGS